LTDTVLARVAALKDMPTPALTRYGYNQAYRCRRLRRRSPGPGYSGVVAAPSLPMNEANVPSRGCASGPQD
jgi:hypothetical protein